MNPVATIHTRCCTGTTLRVRSATWGSPGTAILADAGFDVVGLPFQAHPGMPAGGLSIGPHRGQRYTMIEQEARAAGLALHWPNRIPNSRKALAAAEWVRCNQPSAFAEVHRRLFEAHFVLGEDIDDQAVIDRHATTARVDLDALRAALADGSAVAAVSQAQNFSTSPSRSRGCACEGRPPCCDQGLAPSALLSPRFGELRTRSVTWYLPTRGGAAR